MFRNVRNASRTIGQLRQRDFSVFVVMMLMIAFVAFLLVIGIATALAG